MYRRYQNRARRGAPQIAWACPMARTLATQREQRKGLAYRFDDEGPDRNATNSSSVDRCSTRLMTSFAHEMVSSKDGVVAIGTQEQARSGEGRALVALLESVGLCNCRPTV